MRLYSCESASAGLPLLQGGHELPARRDFVPLQNLLAAPITEETIQAFIQLHRAWPKQLNLSDSNSDRMAERLADLLPIKSEK